MKALVLRGDLIEPSRFAVAFRIAAFDTPVISPRSAASPRR